MVAGLVIIGFIGLWKEGWNVDLEVVVGARFRIYMFVKMVLFLDMI